MYCFQDHPSSDSFYDSDYADGEASTVPVDKVDREIEETSMEQYENPEVDGEWGRQRKHSALFVVGMLIVALKMYQTIICTQK